MDTINSMTSFHYIMSKFADLLIKVKERMDKLRNEIREIIEQLHKENNLKQYNANANHQTEVNLKSMIQVAVIDLEKQLCALEASYKDSWLRTFLYISNYVSTATPKTDKNQEIIQDFIPMHNIMLPDYNNDDFEIPEEYTSYDHSPIDMQEKVIYSKSCRRSNESAKEEKYCFNEEH